MKRMTLTGAEKLAKEVFKSNGYRVLDIRHCLTCMHSFRESPESQLACQFVDAIVGGWSPVAGTVSEDGICNKFKR